MIWIQCSLSVTLWNLLIVKKWKLQSPSIQTNIPRTQTSKTRELWYLKTLVVYAVIQDTYHRVCLSTHVINREPHVTTDHDSTYHVDSSVAESVHWPWKARASRSLCAGVEGLCIVLNVLSLWSIGVLNFTLLRGTCHFTLPW